MVAKQQRRLGDRLVKLRGTQLSWLPVTCCEARVGGVRGGVAR